MHEVELNPQITHTHVDADMDRNTTKTLKRQSTISKKMFAIHVSYKSQIKRFLKPITKPKSTILKISKALEQTFLQTRHMATKDTEKVQHPVATVTSHSLGRPLLSQK